MQSRTSPREHTHQKGTDAFSTVGDGVKVGSVGLLGCLVPVGVGLFGCEGVVGVGLLGGDGVAGVRVGVASRVEACCGATVGKAITGGTEVKVGGRGGVGCAIAGG